MEVHDSARKHDVVDEDIPHAIDNALAIEDAGEDPDRWLVIRPDRAGNLVEVVVMTTVEDTQPAIHCDADASNAQATSRTVTDPRIHGHTSSGRPITDAEVEALAAEAAAGYDVDTLIARRPKRGRPALGSSAASVESVRLDPELRAELLERARAQGTTTSEIIREALRRFLRAA